VASIHGLLSPEQFVTILLCEIGALERGVESDRLDLMELKSVHTVCGDEGNEEEKWGESRQDHGGKKLPRRKQSAL
jgi:hypothetical protein